MKRIILIVFSLLMLLPAWSTDEFRFTTVSLAANLIANFGFTDEYVGESDRLKPVELEGDILFDEYEEGNERIVSAPHRIYWQLFTPDKVTIKAKATSLTADGETTVITWTDTRGTLNCNGETVVYEDAGSGNEIRSNSKPFRLVVDNASLVGINWAKEYGGTITLTLETDS